MDQTRHRLRRVKHQRLDHRDTIRDLWVIGQTREAEHRRVGQVVGIAIWPLRLRSSLHDVDQLVLLQKAVPDRRLGIVDERSVLSVALPCPTWGTKKRLQLFIIDVGVQRVHVERRALFLETVNAIVHVQQRHVDATPNRAQGSDRLTDRGRIRDVQGNSDTPRTQNHFACCYRNLRSHQRPFPQRVAALRYLVHSIKPVPYVRSPQV
ncbi:MAG: hypothetical protein CMH34_09175 [Microbacterium sp.]|nr:hypothetical protein [Microbacterium sp.]